MKNVLEPESYSRQIGVATKRGLAGTIRRGYSVGGRHFGYVSVPVYRQTMGRHHRPIMEGYELSVDQNEARIARLVFELFGTMKVHKRDIARILNTSLFPPPTGASTWSPGLILGILRNEIYHGTLVWNKTHSERCPETGKKRIFPNSRDQWLVVAKPELRIVDETLWKKAQDTLTAEKEERI